MIHPTADVWIGSVPQVTRFYNLQPPTSTLSPQSPPTSWTVVIDAIWQTYYSDDDCSRLSSTFGQFFIDKLNRISNTIAANLKSSSATVHGDRAYSGPLFDGFSAVNVADIQRLLMKMPAKLSPLDVIPSSLLKSCADIFAVIIARLANLSFREGQFPACFKTAQVLPLLKKAGADRADPANFRPISNLSTVSKVLEILALAQLYGHISWILSLTTSVRSNPAFVPVTRQKRRFSSCSTTSTQLAMIDALPSSSA